MIISDYTIDYKVGEGRARVTARVRVRVRGRVGAGANPRNECMHACRHGWVAGCMDEMSEMNELSEMNE